MDLLTERLEALVFKAMQNPKDELYNVELAKVIKQAKGLKVLFGFEFLRFERLTTLSMEG